MVSETGIVSVWLYASGMVSWTLAVYCPGARSPGATLAVNLTESVPPSLVTFSQGWSDLISVTGNLCWQPDQTSTVCASGSGVVCVQPNDKDAVDAAGQGSQN